MFFFWRGAVFVLNRFFSFCVEKVVYFVSKRLFFLVSFVVSISNFS